MIYPTINTISTGSFSFTGSQYGGSGIIRGNNSTGTIKLSAGGEIDISDLDSGRVHDLSIENVSDVSNGIFYVTKHGKANNATTFVDPTLAILSKNNIGLEAETYVSFSRSTSKWYFNVNGLLREASANTLPVSYDHITKERLGWYVEESRTNQILWCRDLTQTEWNVQNGLVANDEIGLDGKNNSASSFESTGSNATVLQSITDGVSEERIYSVYIKRLVGSGSIQITADNGTTWADVTSEIDSDNYNRVSLVDTGTNPVCGIRLVESGDKIAIDINQVENGDFVSSPMITTDTEFNRDSDDPLITDMSWYNDIEGLMVARASSNQTNTANSAGQRAAPWYLYLDDVNNNRPNYETTTNSIYLRGYVGGSATGGLFIGGNPYVRGDFYTTAWFTDFNNYGGTVDGIPISEDNENYSTVSFSTLYIGVVFFTGDGREYLNGYIDYIKYFPKRGSNTQIEVITA